ncbi:hypothetical protein CVT26_003179 [Gymnopilus dilepis]|uniref:Uncharacterized protein n=1 Tax=Gymnopilus dilepis TaxID=231916 RepID=A0A409Y549_9AGAR|nr:hypothetical protein CVT26_003179 [Gymnopilus dilepis]
MFSSAWSALAAAAFAVLAALLAAAPRLLLFLADTDTHQLTPLEAFLATQLAIFLAAVALGIPAPESPLPPQPAPPTQPLLLPLSLAGLVSAFSAYNTPDVGALASLFFAVSLVIGVWGSWEIVFANSASFSKTTGADKHTSAFIFGNKAAASSQKKQLKKQ